MGNICRSPTAHGVFQHLVDKGRLDEQIKVDSAGTISYHAGERPDSRATETARKHGIDLTSQTARQVRASDYEEFDYILAMDFDNLRQLQRDCPEQYQDKLQLLLQYHDDEFMDEVPDPYYGGASGFDNVYNMVELACKNLLSHIKKQGLN